MSDCKLEDPKVREDLEGFLGDDFNGVIFLLREPNTDGDEADSFWFKNCLKDTIPNGKDKKTYRGNYQNYENKFVRLLSYIYQDTSVEYLLSKLKLSAYFNLRPGSGGAKRTHEYDSHLHDKDYVKDRFDEILKYCKPKAKDKCLYIFTCSDISDALQEYGIIHDLTKMNGVTYKRGKQNYPKILIHFKHHGLNIHIYAIYHPSYPSYIYERGE
ncbi:MAG: hypothetical protein K5756_05675 [Clostridiales bacterium]|nr:hypothetical protein [Clostridiales bacterium]